MRKIYKLVAFKYNMISNIELRLLKEIGSGKSTINELIMNLGLSKSQIYRILKSLEKKDIIKDKRPKIILKNETYIALLMQLLIKNPKVIDILSDSGISILIETIKGGSVKEISRITGFKDAIIYRKLKKALSLSINKKNKDKFTFNQDLWQNLKEFLLEYDKHSMTIDNRISIGSIIYFKKDDELVFESKNVHDAVFTAFSVYPKYGINIILPEKFYYLPIKKLTKEHVFLHSLYVCEKKKESRYFIYSAIFYLKFKKYLNNIDNPILENIKKIIKDEIIPGYPKFEEIKEKARQYDIRV